MSRQANLVIIGLFVLGAVFLLAGTVVVLGTGFLLKNTETRVLYFEGSVAGLQVGAPVAFRGVKVGEVTDLQVQLGKDMGLLIPVIVELDPGRVKDLGSESGPGEALEQLVKQGLKAQLELQSIVTGLLYVNLDFYPDQSPVFRGTDQHIEIPTLPSPLERIRSLIGDLPLKEIAENVSGSLKSLRALLEAPELSDAVHELRAAVADIRNLVVRLDSQIDPIGKEVRATLQKGQGAMDEVEDSVKALQRTLKAAESAFAQMQATLQPNSPLQHETLQSLQEFRQAARSLRNLSDYLERNPQSLLRGKR